jgi:hypothetical protein
MIHLFFFLRFLLVYIDASVLTMDFLSSHLSWWINFSVGGVSGLWRDSWLFFPGLCKVGKITFIYPFLFFYLMGLNIWAYGIFYYLW